MFQELENNDISSNITQNNAPRKGTSNNNNIDYSTIANNNVKPKTEELDANIGKVLFTSMYKVFIFIL